VSRANHARRLRSLERPKVGGWLAEFHQAIRENDREQVAAVTMVRVAQALAGTVMQPRWVDNGNRDPAPELASRTPPPPELLEITARRARREPQRLDHHTEATWEEAFRQPWVAEPLRPACGQILVAAPSQVPRPEGWIDPWGGSEFVFPSYAEGEEEE
jgi:hypothetical protein